MVEWFERYVAAPVADFFGGSIVFVLTNLTAIAGFVLALLILARMMREKRNPSNFFAWAFFIILLPPVAVPLYFIFGGRKSQWLTRLKREVREVAQSASGEPPEAPDKREEQRDFVGTTFDGNRFELLPDGATALRRLQEEIDRADQCIHIATYILGRDAVGREIVERLARRAEEGVRVRLLLDAMGSWTAAGMARRRIRRAGGEVSVFMPMLPVPFRRSANLRNHRKIAIFDHRRAIVGGQNLDERFLGAEQGELPFRDFGAALEGPAVAFLNRTFVADWAFAANQSPREFRELLRFVPENAGDSILEVMNSGPDVRGDPLWEHIIRVIQEFNKELTIVTPYFIPDEVIFRSLLVKAHTGRRIRLILPLRSNWRLADIARAHYLRQLHQAGVRILLYKPKMMHGKLLLADGRVAMMGSANIDVRSLFVNFEIGLFHYSDTDIGALSRWAADLERDCVAFDERRLPRAAPRIVEDLVHLIVPLL